MKTAKRIKKVTFYGRVEPRWLVRTAWITIYSYFPMLFVSTQLSAIFTNNVILRDDIWWSYSIIGATIILVAAIILRSKLLFMFAPIILFSYFITFFGVYAPN